MNLSLVTGAAGFIGYHLCQRLLARGDQVVGLDNLSDYYDIDLKKARLARLQSQSGFTSVKMDISDRTAMDRLFAQYPFESVVNLAAQVGVRYSLINPHAYITSNIVGFLNILESCRQVQVKHLVFASSSSVYGANTKVPFSVRDNVDHPISLYAATKKSNELMAYTYAHLYGLPCTGLRFFTVYGPWGRPDMALFLFTRRILEGRPIDVFNQGRHRRDFTYIDDVVEGMVRVLNHVPTPDPDCSGSRLNPTTSRAPYRIYNIGNHEPVELLHVIGLLESALGHRAQKNFLPMQPGDVLETWADVQDLRRDVGFEPGTPIEDGIRRFVAWYLDFYGERRLG